MNKDKQIKELERKYILIKEERRILFVVTIVLMLFVLYVGIFGTYDERQCKTQLSECQDKVPVWTLKFVCTDFSGRYSFERNFTDYEDYKDIKDTIERQKAFLYKGCEVIK